MDVASATLSGGVAVGAVADMMIGPAVAFAAGTFMGVVSTLGFRRLQARLHHKFGCEPMERNGWNTGSCNLFMSFAGCTTPAAC